MPQILLNLSYVPFKCQSFHISGSCMRPNALAWSGLQGSKSASHSSFEIRPPPSVLWKHFITCSGVTYRPDICSVLLRKQGCHRTPTLSLSSERPQSPDNTQPVWRRRRVRDASTAQHHIISYPPLCSKSLAVNTLPLCVCVCVCVLYIRSNRSSPATDSPDTPSPLPDPAFQLAAEAKELVAGVCTSPADDTGTEHELEYTRAGWKTLEDSR